MGVHVRPECRVVGVTQHTTQTQHTQHSAVCSSDRGQIVVTGDRSLSLFSSLLLFLFFVFFSKRPRQSQRYRTERPFHALSHFRTHTHTHTHARAYTHTLSLSPLLA